MIILLIRGTNTLCVCPDRSEILFTFVILEDMLGRGLLQCAVRGEVSHVTDDLSSVERVD